MVILKKDGHEVEILPERGAIVSRWTYKGKRILYEDANLENVHIIRGGMPILFPLCGQLQDDVFHYNEKQFRLTRHGFARDYKWEIVELQDDCVKLLLKASAETLTMYPFHFECTVLYSLSGNQLTVSSSVKNNGDVNMPYQIGFHPYFWTENKLAAKLVYNWHEEVTDIAKFSHAYVLQTSNFRLTVTSVKGFDHVVVWSLPGEPFICVEPWLRSIGAIQSKESPIIQPHCEKKHVFIIEVE